MGFSRQEYWSGLPFPSPATDTKAIVKTILDVEKLEERLDMLNSNMLIKDKDFKVIVKVDQSCPTLCDPMNCSPLGSSVHGILQASILKWVAISFSKGSF